jgi:hypothetical protein
VLVALDITKRAGVPIPRGVTVDLDDAGQVGIYVHDCLKAGLVAEDVKKGMHGPRRSKFWPTSAEFVKRIKDQIGWSPARIEDPVQIIDERGRVVIGERADAEARGLRCLPPLASVEELVAAGAVLPGVNRPALPGPMDKALQETVQRARRG